MVPFRSALLHSNYDSGLYRGASRVLGGHRCPTDLVDVLCEFDAKGQRVYRVARRFPLAR